MNARQRHVEEIKATQKELDRSRGYNKKDVFRKLVRLKRELKQYDILMRGVSNG